MRTWMNRKMQDIMLRNPVLVVQATQGNTRELHTVVAQEVTGEANHPLHTALATFTDPKEAVGWMTKAKTFAARVKQPKGKAA